MFFDLQGPSIQASSVRESSDIRSSRIILAGGDIVGNLIKYLREDVSSVARVFYSHPNEYNDIKMRLIMRSDLEVKFSDKVILLKLNDDAIIMLSSPGGLEDDWMSRTNFDDLPDTPPIAEIKSSSVQRKCEREIMQLTEKIQSLSYSLETNMVKPRWFDVTPTELLPQLRKVDRLAILSNESGSVSVCIDVVSISMTVIVDGSDHTLSFGKMTAKYATYLVRRQYVELIQMVERKLKKDGVL